MDLLATLLFYIKVMNEKQKPDGEPGYLHFLVLANYIRQAIATGKVDWAELGLSGEASLCKIELDCLAYANEHHEKQAKSFADWTKPALEAKLKLAQGKPLNAEEGDNVVELFPEAEAEAA